MHKNKTTELLLVTLKLYPWIKKQREANILKVFD